MTLLNVADSIRLGDKVAVEVNVGENKVWPPEQEEEEPDNEE